MVLSAAGQRLFFERVLPMMPKLAKLKLPSNQFEDSALELLLDYMKLSCSTLKKLNIGNNFFHPESLAQFFEIIIRKQYPLK